MVTSMHRIWVSRVMYRHLFSQIIGTGTTWFTRKFQLLNFLLFCISIRKRQIKFNVVVGESSTRHCIIGDRRNNTSVGSEKNIMIDKDCSRYTEHSIKKEIWTFLHIVYKNFLVLQPFLMSSRERYLADPLCWTKVFRRLNCSFVAFTFIIQGHNIDM